MAYVFRNVYAHLMQYYAFAIYVQYIHVYGVIENLSLAILPCVLITTWT